MLVNIKKTVSLEVVKITKFKLRIKQAGNIFLVKIRIIMLLKS